MLIFSKGTCSAPRATSRGECQRMCSITRLPGYLSLLWEHIRQASTGMNITWATPLKPGGGLRFRIIVDKYKT